MLLPEEPTAQAHLLSWERRLLLEELASISLALGREMAPPAASGAASEPLPLSQTDRPDRNALVSPWERLRLLHALWPRLDAALEMRERHPDSGIVRQSRLTPLPHTRGDAELARKIACTPDGQKAWLERNARPKNALSPPETARLPENRPLPTPDTLANRFVVTLLQTLEAEANALASLARFCAEEAEAERMQTVRGGAQRRLRSETLRGLRPLTAAERSLLPAAAPPLRYAPPYRLLFQAWLTLDAPLRFDWAHLPLLRLPSVESWRLYEIWCFLRTAAALRASGWQVVDGDALRYEANGLRLCLQTGRASRLRFLPASIRSAPARTASAGDASPLLELFYQPLFPSANRRLANRTTDAEDAPILSLTHAMQPDIALRFRGRLFLLDPKYRTYATPDEGPKEADARHEESALQTDIDKMHAYRDSLVRSGQRVVDSAWCLFPGSAERTKTIVAYPSGVTEQPFGTAGIGALRLRPGEAPDLLASLITHWLETQERR